MKKKNLLEVGDKITALKSSFSFGGKTPRNFDKHISKSVPLYKDGQDLICKLSSFFLSKNSNVYDLGCSTGSLITQIDKYHPSLQINLHGIDIEKKMISVAKKKIQKSKNKISFRCADILKFGLKKSDLVIAYYTIQFVKPKFRQFLFDKIYKSLNWGGAFIFFEKVRAPDARFQDMMSQIYHEYKVDNGIKEKIVYQKSLSLRRVLEPYSTRQNLSYLKNSGFKDYMSIAKFCSFEGFLAIK